MECYVKILFHLVRLQMQCQFWLKQQIAPLFSIVLMYIFFILYTIIFKKQRLFKSRSKKLINLNVGPILSICGTLDKKYESLFSYT